MFKKLALLSALTLFVSANTQTFDLFQAARDFSEKTQWTTLDTAFTVSILPVLEGVSKLSRLSGPAVIARMTPFCLVSALAYKTGGIFADKK